MLCLSVVERKSREKIDLFNAACRTDFIAAPILVFAPIDLWIAFALVELSGYSEFAFAPQTVCHRD